MVPGSWYQDLDTKMKGTKILAPRSWYPPQKEEFERRSLSKIEQGDTGGCRPPLEGLKVWGARSPPGTARGLGGGSPPPKTIVCTQNHFPTTFNHFQPSANHLRPPSYHLRPPTNHLHQALQTIINFREMCETCTPPLGQGFRTAWLITGQKLP